MKMLLIGSDRASLEGIARGFQNEGFTLAAITDTAAKAQELIEIHKPNLLIMEPYLPGMNCDELTALLEERIKEPMVKLVLSDQKQDLLAERFMSNGGDLFRVLPMDYEYTANRLRECYEERCHPKVPDSFSKEDRARIRRYKELLQQLGMSITRRGYRYIWYGALVVEQNPSVLDNRTRYLYPAIAVYYQVSPGSVERCIRTAIEKTYELGNSELLNRLFPPRLDSGKQSNGAFIGRVVDLCRTD